ncbi:MAG: hypothetical protein IH989_01705 [Planctomycetes bacterium]|nr:hypothetical protein [Planctomycetota bacterium]
MAELPTCESATHASEPAGTGKPVSPVPPRYWWLKRIVIVSVAFLIVLIGVRLWWGWEANRRLQAEIDRIIAAGEPIYPADFDPPPMRPEENAAKLYLDAEAALNLNPTQGDFVNQLASEYAEIRKRLDEVEPFVLANAEAFQLVRRAGELKKVDWGGRVRSPAINFLLPNLSMHRHMSKILSITATYHAERGNDVEALTTLLDSFRFSEAIDHEPFLITHLVAIACRALVVHDIEHIVPTLAITSKTRERDGSSTAAPRELVFTLITELLDDTSLQAALVRAMQADRMILLDMAQMIIRGDAGIGSLASWTFAPPSLLERVLAFPLTPMIELDALVGIRFGSAFVDGAGKPNWPSALTTLPPEPSDWSPLERLTRPVSGIVISSLGRAVFLHFRLLAEMRMAAIALAIRLYEVDHGRRPDALAELVPEYLSAVPMDPLAADDRPIAYLPDAPKPILYSVGENGTDDGGSYTVHSSGRLDRSSLDRPFFLDGDRPTRRRDADDSGETDDDGDDVEGDRGDSEQDEPAQR